jgi:hypothetical protein
MKLRIALASAVLTFAGHGQSPDTNAIVARMQESALAYTGHLQNFTCTQTLTRSAGNSPTGPHWKRLDTQESVLEYVDHKEHYNLLKVNGETLDPQKRIKRGPYLTPGGEFGSMLLRIFVAKAQAQFEWDHDETIAGVHTCVFRYNVPLATTTEAMQVDVDKVRLGHHGIVWADCESGAVTRFRMESDIGEVTRRGRPVPVGFRLEIRYAPTAIGDSEFLLPQSAAIASLFDKTWTKIDIGFHDYRKYGADSIVKFSDGKD